MFIYLLQAMDASTDHERKNIEKLRRVSDNVIA